MLNIKGLLDEALRHCPVDKLVEAERLCHEILTHYPSQADSLHRLGGIVYETGHGNIAAELIRKAIARNGQVAAYHSNLGVVLKSLGRLDEAVAAYTAATRVQPGFADAHYNMGNALCILGRLDDAVRAYDSALRAKPDYAQAYCNLGNALRDLGHFEEAATRSMAAICIKPDFAEACSNLGNALNDLGDLDKAVSAYTFALHLQPDYAQAYSNLGAVLRRLGRLNLSVAATSAAICIKPDCAEAHSNLGNSLQHLGRPEAAITARAIAIRIRPDYAEALCGLGIALGELQRLDDAVAAYSRAICTMPDFAEAYSNLGVVLKDQGRVDDAIVTYKTAVRIKPDYDAPYSNLLYILHCRPGITGEVILAEAKLFGSRFPAPIRKFANTAEPERRLRIGYVSGDFRRHPVGYFLTAVLNHRDSGTVENFCYSNHQLTDDLTECLRNSSNHWRSITGLSDEDAAMLIATDRIDILVDLSGHTNLNRLSLFARKPAPLQLSWLGYWGTTGLAAMDYILSDEITIPPDEEAFYRERVLRLPGGRFCYTPPTYAPAVSPPPRLRCDKVTFGSFNDLAKVGSEVVRLWAAILRAVPGSRLLLKWKTLLDAGVVNRVIAAFEAAGVEAERLVLRGASPHGTMLAEYGDIDIALDPFPFSGGLTSCEALWMGVPVVTLPQVTAPSRQTQGFLQAIGLSELVATDPDDYVRIVAELAKDCVRLKKLRQNLRIRMANSSLCNGPAFTKNIEAAYRKIWRNWCA